MIAKQILVADSESEDISLRFHYLLNSEYKSHHTVYSEKKLTIP